MRRTVTAAIAAIAVAAFGAGAAQAQVAHDPADQNGAMYCVYNLLTMSTEDYEIVAEAFLYDDLAESEIKAASDILNNATTSCAETHKMSESQAASAADIGIYGSTADYLSDELMFEDVSQEAVDGIYEVLSDLSDDEMDKLYSDDWRSDLPFSTKVKAALVAKGIPDDEFAVETSFQILVLAMMAVDSVALFVDGAES